MQKCCSITANKIYLIISIVPLCLAASICLVFASFYIKTCPYSLVNLPVWLIVIDIISIIYVIGLIVSKLRLKIVYFTSILVYFIFCIIWFIIGGYDLTHNWYCFKSVPFFGSMVAAVLFHFVVIGMSEIGMILYQNDNCC